MLNVKFPETPYVECVYGLRTNGVFSRVFSVNPRQYENEERYDEYDRVIDKSRLKRYVYKLPDELVGNIKVGDYVCVHCANGYNVCEVVTVNAITTFDVESIQPVLCKVDISGYIERVEKKKQQQMIKAALDARKKELEATMAYEMFAERDQAFAQLLAQYKELGGKL